MWWSSPCSSSSTIPASLFGRCFSLKSFGKPYERDKNVKYRWSRRDADLGWLVLNMWLSIFFKHQSFFQQSAKLQDNLGNANSLHIICFNTWFCALPKLYFHKCQSNMFSLPGTRWKLSYTTGVEPFPSLHCDFEAYSVSSRFSIWFNMFSIRSRYQILQNSANIK